MATDQEPKKLQSPARMSQSASLADMRSDVLARVPASKRIASRKESIAPAPQGVRVAFFFDGTGNNLDADIGNDEHSNVARLFRAHLDDEPALGIFSYYIPGIGTRFKEINDPGGETRGLAFGAKGGDRLDWAMDRLEDRLGQSKDRTVHLALFGFSRGAALARAFALRIAKRCERGGDGIWRFTHKKAKHPLRLYFMGLFDTVASVGSPMGTNNAQSIDLTLGMLDLRDTLRNRHSYGSTLDDIAFASGGAPGADPASGMANGHMDWADDLHIPEMAEDCLHMVAAHEVRNSFPLDSVLQGSRYPRNCREWVYPGAHSDVGGGYRRGEGARSPTPGSLLSLVALRAMRAEAIRAGVPLMAEIRAENRKSDFAENPASKAAFETLNRRFNHYMEVAGWGGKPLGAMMLSHMKLYYQWRFQRIARNRARATGSGTPDQDFLRGFEPSWAKEERDLKEATTSLQSKTKEHEARAKKLRGSAAGMIGDGPRQVALESKLAAQMEDKYLTEKARLDTMPSSDGSFVRNSLIYDNQLLEDARVLQALAKKKGRDKLRPHYRAVLEAYEAEFERRQGLRDQDIIAFFDTYVHDSLAGFAKDATLPSDPRVIYIGGDEKLPYAMNNKPPRRGIPTSALG